MFKAILKRIVSLGGYEIRKISDDKTLLPGLIQYRYLREDGSFDYEKYRIIQEKGNRDKLEKVWVIEENIAFLSHYIRRIIPSPQFGICHGTRRGKEQEWFKKYVNCDVIGTEISSTAEQFKYTIRWDFHETKPEWLERADFIYSNSFDHSYDPKKCLNAWMSCIKKGGLCILEHSTLHGPSGASELDPFGAELVLMPFLITTWGEGRYGVRELLQAPNKAEGLESVNFIIIQKF